jgi:hypothetical protein
VGRAASPAYGILTCLETNQFGAAAFFGRDLQGSCVQAFARHGLVPAFYFALQVLEWLYNTTMNALWSADALTNRRLSLGILCLESLESEATTRSRFEQQ